jgi:hypothetical protein
MKKSSESSISATPNGTAWANTVPDSEDMTESVGWTNLGFTIIGKTTIGGIPAVGMSADSGNAHQRDTLAGGSISANNVFVSAHVRKALATWAALSVSATNGVGAANGGSVYYNIDAGVVGSFIQINAGTLTEAGIRKVSDGFYIWAVIDCQGDDTFGATYALRPATDDTDNTSPSDPPEISLYMGGLMRVDGPTGELPYIPT